METVFFDYILEYISLSKKEKETLLALKIFKSYKKGAIILNKGQVSDNYYFINKGCIRSYYEIDGEEKTTAFYMESEGFYPQSCETGKPSNHFISCVKDSVITVVNPSLEEILFKESPSFLKMFLALSKKSNVQMQSSFDEFKTSSPEQRYLSIQKNRPDLLQLVPQYQMASYLGITPQSLSRLRGRILKNAN